MEHLEGIAAADARLGRPFPLPTAAIPLVRWSDVHELGEGVELELNLDDTRGGPGRLAIYAGAAPAPDQGLPPAEELEGGFTLATAALEVAQPSLRPVRELRWRAGDLHLRITAQGPWPLDALIELAESMRV